jgi:hypothetical protein
MWIMADHFQHNRKAMSPLITYPVLALTVFPVVQVETRLSPSFWTVAQYWFPISVCTLVSIVCLGHVVFPQLIPARSVDSITLHARDHDQTSSCRLQQFVFKAHRSYESYHYVKVPSVCVYWNEKAGPKCYPYWQMFGGIIKKDYKFSGFHSSSSRGTRGGQSI